MKEVIKNFIAYIVTAMTWIAGIAVLVLIFDMFKNGLQEGELKSLLIALCIFGTGIFLGYKYKRIRSELIFPF